MNRSQILSNKYIIMRLLHITELQYSEIIEQLGYEYLRVYFADKDGNLDYFSIKLIHVLTHSKIFWIWWLFRWNDNDEKYLKQLEHKPELKSKHAYIDYHRLMFYPMPDYLLKKIINSKNEREWTLKKKIKLKYC